MSNRGKRVLVYTAALLIAPLPVIPFVPGERELAFALITCGTILSLSSFYVVRGEIRSGARDLLGKKLIASSLITLVFGGSMLVAAIVFLLR